MSQEFNDLLLKEKVLAVGSLLRPLVFKQSLNSDWFSGEK